MELLDRRKRGRPKRRYLGVAKEAMQLVSERKIQKIQMETGFAVAIPNGKSERRRNKGWFSYVSVN